MSLRPPQPLVDPSERFSILGTADGRDSRSPSRGSQGGAAPVIGSPRQRSGHRDNGPGASPGTNGRIWGTYEVIVDLGTNVVVVVVVVVVAVGD